MTDSIVYAMREYFHDAVLDCAAVTDDLEEHFWLTCPSLVDSYRAILYSLMLKKMIEPSKTVASFPIFVGLTSFEDQSRMEDSIDHEDPVIVKLAKS